MSTGTSGFYQDEDDEVDCQEVLVDGGYIMFFSLSGHKLYLISERICCLTKACQRTAVLLQK